MKIIELPFNQFIGIEKSATSVSLKKQHNLLNHVGSLHAAAIYGLAESASGDYLISQLLPLFPGAQALVREGSIKYRRPAENDCVAEVSVADEKRDACINSLESRKQAILTIPVRIISNDHPIATATFNWWLSLK